MQTDGTWSWRRIIYSCKPYIDAELDIALERLLFTKKRPRGVSYAQFLTQLKKLRDDVCNIWGHEEIKCPHCEYVDRKKKKIPEEIWRYLIVKNCETTKEEKMLMMQRLRCPTLAKCGHEDCCGSPLSHVSVICISCVFYMDFIWFYIVLMYF